MGRLDNLAAAAPQLAPSNEHNNATAKMETRYKDAYRRAFFIIGVGRVIHIIGAAIGILIGIGGFSAASEIFRSPYGRQSDTGMQFGFAMLLVGGAVWFVFFIFSVIVSAIGQQLLATLDSAVNSSPFLDMEGKAKAMSLN